MALKIAQIVLLLLVYIAETSVAYWASRLLFRCCDRMLYKQSSGARAATTIREHNEINRMTRVVVEARSPRSPNSQEYGSILTLSSRSDVQSDMRSASSILQVKSPVFSDARTIFFASVFTSCMFQAATNLIFLIHYKFSQSEQLEDAMTAPQSFTIHCTYVILLFVLFHLPGNTNRADTLGLSCLVIIVLLFAIYVTGTVLIMAYYSLRLLLEFAIPAIEACIVIAFSVAAVRIPKRINEISIDLQPVATKVRRLSILVVVCFALRLAAILPWVQSLWTSDTMKRFAVVFFNTISILPFAGSLLLLKV